MTKPALTAEEWEAVDSGASALADITQDYDAHSAAAVLLHDQPFGFTWEDERGLRATAKLLRNLGSPYNDNVSKILKLADRIAALLPPREQP